VCSARSSIEAQNASIHRLHEAQRSGQIKSFVFGYYLRQARPQLAEPASGPRAPRRNPCCPDEWIEGLSLRGEQLTLCLTRISEAACIRSAGRSMNAPRLANGDAQPNAASASHPKKSSPD
jgi:hypothetical protein